MKYENNQHCQMMRIVCTKFEQSIPILSLNYLFHLKLVLWGVCSQNVLPNCYAMGGNWLRNTFVLGRGNPLLFPTAIYLSDGHCIILTSHMSHYCQIKRKVKIVFLFFKEHTFIEHEFNVFTTSSIFHDGCSRFLLYYHMKYLCSFNFVFSNYQHEFNKYIVCYKIRKEGWKSIKNFNLNIIVWCHKVKAYIISND